MGPQPPKERLSVFYGPPIDVLGRVADDLPGKDLWRTSTQSVRGRAGAQPSALSSRPEQPATSQVRKGGQARRHDLPPPVQLTPGSTSPDRAFPHTWLEKAKAIARNDFQVM